MVKLLGKWVAVALTVLAIPYLVSGIRVDSFGTALALALVLGLFNIILKPLLILFTLPFTLVTFGLFLWVINGVVFWMSAQFVSGVQVESFGAAFFAALWVSLISSLFSLSFKREEGRIRWTFEHKGKRIENTPTDIDLEKDPSGHWR